MDNDFIKWEKNSSQFFEDNKVRFERIIKRYYYCGHLLKNQTIEKINEIIERMHGKEIHKQLLAYSGKSKFVNFYQTVLLEVVKRYNQKEDEFLLGHNQNSLVLKYRKLIDEIKNDLIIKGKLSCFQSEDLVNHINLVLLEKDLNKNFNNNKLFSNYLWIIIHNECISYLKSLQSKVCMDVRKFCVNNLCSTIQFPDAEKNLIIEDEFVRFNRILSSFDRKRPKIELCLKVQYLIEVFSDDVIKLNHRIHKKDVKNVVNKINKSYNKNTSKNPEVLPDRFEIILPVLYNKHDNKIVKVKAVIRWTNSKKNELINILNNGYARSCFDNKTFSIFVEKYFHYI